MAVSDLLLNILSRSDKRGLTEAADELDKLGRKADGAGEKLGGMAKESGHVDEQITKTKAKIRELGEEFDKTGSKELLPQLRRERGSLAALEKIGKELAKVGQEAGVETGKNFSAGLQGSLKTPVLGPALIAGLVGAAIVAAPAIGAAVASGVTLGVGGGALAAGIVLAAKDQRVKSAWGDFGKSAKDELTSAAGVFVQPLVNSTRILRSAFGEIMPGIRGDFASLAPLVERLSSGVAGFVTNAMPGVNRLVDAAGPFLQDLADELPNIGNAMSDFFSSLSAGGPGAKQFFHDLLVFTEKTIVAVGNMVEFLSKGYALVSGIAAGMHGDMTGALRIMDQFGDKGPTNLHTFRDAALGVAREAQIMTGGLESATRAAGSLSQAFDVLNGGFINSTQAAINAEANIDALTESVKQHGNSLNIDTAAGRDNVGIIVKGAEMARDAAQAKYQETGSLEQAKATYDGYIGKLRTTAGDLQFNKQKTDELFTSISKMPPLKATQIQLPGIDSAIEKVISMQTYLNGLQSRTITVTTVQNTQTGETRVVRRSGPEFRRWGGITEHAALGTLRDANVYPAVSSGARYAFAEPSTGGELFAPKYGDLKRTRGLISYGVENWWGGHVSWGDSTASAPGGGSGGGGMAGGPAGMAGGAGQLTLTFAGNTDGAFATAFMNLIRTGVIQIQAS